MDPSPKLRSDVFYWNYHGHRIEDLSKLHGALRQAGCQSFVWLAGDSSLDNKHWLFEGEKSDPKVMYDDDVAAAALNGYEKVLTPPRMAQDVCYWLNAGLERERLGSDPERSGPSMCAMNTAVEESTLGERLRSGLTPQDQFLRDNLTEDDVLVVNVGGNDIALKPTVWTGLYMAALVYLTCTAMIRDLSCVCACFRGCHCGFPLGLSYFVNMFRHDTADYIRQLTARRKPKKVIACMLYYLDEKPGGSWADSVLGMLGYDTNPAKLKAVIKRVFELGTSRISVPGVEVVPFPLFTALDGTNSRDYLQRVEPSAEGGRKMAEGLLPEISR